MKTPYGTDLERRITTALTERAQTLDAPSPTRRPIGAATVGVPFVERVSRSRSGRGVLVAAAAAVIAIAVPVALVAADHEWSSSRERVIAPPTASSVPAPAGLECPLSGVGPNGKTYGTAPWSGGSGGPMPDFVAVTSHRQRVGYINMSTAQSAASSGVVYGCDLRTVVGHLVPNKGFIPIGINPETVPTLANPHDLHRADQCIEEQKPITC